MGDFASGRITSALGWLLACVVVGVNTYLIVITFQDSGGQWYLTLTAVVVMVPYAIFSLYLAIAPLFKWSKVRRRRRPQRRDGARPNNVVALTLILRLFTRPPPARASPGQLRRIYRPVDGEQMAEELTQLTLSTDDDDALLRDSSDDDLRFEL